MKQVLKFSIICLIIFLFSSTSLYAQETKVKIGGFIQTTAIKAEDNSGFKFGFDRVRVIANGTLNS